MKDCLLPKKVLVENIGRLAALHSKSARIKIVSRSNFGRESPNLQNIFTTKDLCYIVQHTSYLELVAYVHIPGSAQVYMPVSGTT